MADEAFKAKNVVLVHGAFADGSSWSGVVEFLQSAGLHVAAVQNPLTSLKDDVEATKRALAMQDGPTVLVGHSYGGTVISEVGVDPKVTGLVYVAALAPEPDEDVSPTGKLTMQFPTPPAGASIRAANGFAQFDEAGFIENFAPDVPPSRARVLAASQGPIAQDLFYNKTTVAAWQQKPSWYAVSTKDRVIDPDPERFFAKRMNAYTLVGCQPRFAREPAECDRRADQVGGPLKTALLHLVFCGTLVHGVCLPERAGSFHNAASATRAPRHR
jgi:pimeloyl-ACP methyl ester carboxylesterase